MKKKILATSKKHRWHCGMRYYVEKFRDSGGGIRYEIRTPRGGRFRWLISRRAIVAMAEGDYYKYVPGIGSWTGVWRLRVPSPFGFRVWDAEEKTIVQRAARRIIKELAIPMKGKR